MNGNWKKSQQGGDSMSNGYNRWRKICGTTSAVQAADSHVVAGEDADASTGAAAGFE